MRMLKTTTLAAALPVALLSFTACKTTSSSGTSGLSKDELAEVDAAVEEGVTTKKAAGHFKKSVAYLQKNNGSSARQQLELAFEADPTFAVAKYNLGVIAEIARVQALARAEESNTVALEATEAGYDVGTRTTVDILNARQSLFLTQTQYARAKYDYLINVLRLKQAAGTLTQDDVKLLDSWLVEKESLEGTPGRGNQPDTNLQPGTPSSGGIVEELKNQEPGAGSAE